jgi:beta-glucuronidase
MNRILGLQVEKAHIILITFLNDLRFVTKIPHNCPAAIHLTFFNFLMKFPVSALPAIFFAASTALLPAADAGPEASANPTAMINVDHRQTTSLAGTWEVIIDPFLRGLVSNDLTERPAGSVGQFSSAEVNASKFDKQEYGFENGERLDVPGDWNTQDDRLLFYEGAVWYKRNFDYDLKKSQRLFVYFGAANYFSIAYLNGKELGRHYGGFTPFNYEITDIVKPEGNTLVVMVDNTRNPDGIPTLMYDWWNYGGLTRRVDLIEEPATFIRDYKVQLKKDSHSQIAGWIELDGANKAQDFTISIPEAGIFHAGRTNDDGRADFEFEADLELWSPEDPKLYTVELTSETDSIKDTIGFRSVQVKGRDILLNGKPIFLRGISIHEEAPFRTGRAFSEEDARTLLGWAKEMGCNFVRLAHYPHNENMVRVADEIGLLVWSEIPLYWAIDWKNPVVEQRAQQMLTQMIARDKNRAAVILWSVANETRLSDARLEFLRNLVDLARKEDPTRLITAALLAEKGYVDGRDDNVEGSVAVNNVNDPLGKYLDVIGCNQYVGWYGPRDNPTVFETTLFKTPYEKPFVFSEFGADARQGLRGDEETVWTEDFQRAFYERQVRMIDRFDFVRGTAPWILMDFRSPRRLLPRIQDYYNRKGLISERGQKKDAFFVMQEYYKKKKEEQK